MIESMSILGLVSSLLLPWLCGTTWTLWLLRKSGHWNGFIVTGHGYLVGILLTTLLIRLWSFLGLELQFWNLATTLACLMLLGFVALGTQSVPESKARPTSTQLPATASHKWQTAIITILLGLILYRQITLLQEIILRPLFPWDAWMNWAPKAIVWFNQGSMVPYTSPEQWSQQPTSSHVYTLGNQQAWKYPITVPLIQLWGMLGAGTDDHPLLYLPWLIVVIALGLALYGHLRLSSLSPLGAIIACYVLLNLPYINIHTVLTGYADLWLASAFGLATFALHGSRHTGHWSYALLALFFAGGCALIKVPGMVLGAIVATVVLFSLTRLNLKLTAMAAMVTAIFLGLVITVGVEFELPLIGQITVNSSTIELPYIGHFSLQYHPVHSAFITTFFTTQNWNMLWYVFVSALIIFTAKRKWREHASSELALVILGLLFVCFTFYFTRHYIAALRFTTVNRALLYVIPALIFYLAMQAPKRTVPPLKH